MFAYGPTSRRLAGRLARPVQLAARSQRDARAYAAAATAAATATVVGTEPQPPPPPPRQWTPRSFPVSVPATDPPSGRRPNGKQILREAVAATDVRNDWTREEIAAIYHEPLMELVHQAVRQGPRPHVSTSISASAFRRSPLFVPMIHNKD